MSKSRHNNKWFDADDYEYETFSYGKKKQKSRFDEVEMRREEKRIQRDKTFVIKENDDWD